LASLKKRLIGWREKQLKLIEGRRYRVFVAALKSQILVPIIVFRNEFYRKKQRDEKKNN
jgi:hypothetical protein